MEIDCKFVGISRIKKFLSFYLFIKVSQGPFSYDLLLIGFLLNRYSAVKLEIMGIVQNLLKRAVVHLLNLRIRTRFQYLDAKLA